jgi:hypothetical protein
MPPAAPASAAENPGKAGFGPLIALCAAIIAALLVVGVVSHGVIRHIVQTSPLWIAILLAARRSNLTKWAALPCFVFWLFLMTLIWLYLLGWARIVSGTFSPIEIAMTVIVGLASLAGILWTIRMRSNTPVLPALGLVIVIAGLHILALRISLLPAIAHR